MCVGGGGVITSGLDCKITERWAGKSVTEDVSKGEDIVSIMSNVDWVSGESANRTNGRIRKKHVKFACLTRR